MLEVVGTIFVLIMFGGLIASFCNCVAYRIPRHMDWVTGRSICPSCGKELTPLELVPIFSCLFLKARCAKCHTHFGWSNTLSELGLGLAYAVCWLLEFDIVIRIIFILLVSVLFFICSFVHQRKRFRLK